MATDVLLVGGGLANLLVAWRLAELRPEVSFQLLESGSEIGGNHTWSFHDADVEPEQRRWVVPLARASWARQELLFPELTRSLDAGYHAIDSADLARRCRARFGDRIRTGASVTRLEPAAVTLADGTRLESRSVLDGRGWRAEAPIPVGYQRFVGFEVALDRDHGLGGPILMDATVPQEGGFRFVYVLPFDRRTLLIEDTCYADTPGHDRDAARRLVEGYAIDRGWRIAATVREERGALPIPLAGRYDQLVGGGSPAVPVIGVRAGLFHATTGYSLPFAARTADLVARTPRLTSEALAPAIRDWARSVWERQSFFRLLNRMLFCAAAPERRYRVLERFYRLPAELIERFYGDRLELRDRIRLLVGKPPVPFLRGLACLPDRVPSLAR